MWPQNFRKSNRNVKFNFPIENFYISFVSPFPNFSHGQSVIGVIFSSRVVCRKVESVYTKHSCELLLFESGFCKLFTDEAVLYIVEGGSENCKGDHGYVSRKFRMRDIYKQIEF